MDNKLIDNLLKKYSGLLLGDAINEIEKELRERTLLEIRK